MASCSNVRTCWQCPELSDEIHSVDPVAAAGQPCLLWPARPSDDTSEPAGPCSCAENASPYWHIYCGQATGRPVCDLEEKHFFKTPIRQCKMHLFEKLLDTLNKFCWPWCNDQVQAHSIHRIMMIIQKPECLIYQTCWQMRLNNPRCHSWVLPNVLSAQRESPPSRTWLKHFLSAPLPWCCLLAGPAGNTKKWNLNKALVVSIISRLKTSKAGTSVPFTATVAHVTNPGLLHCILSVPEDLSLALLLFS